MTKTFYQVWRFNPLKNEWFYYGHIPNATTAQAVKDIFEQHRKGEYKPNQFKPWMKNDQFKIVEVDQTIKDVELL
jgi:hypothetical protein